MKKQPIPVESEEEHDSFIREKKGFELFGKPLRPYSASRKVAAQYMGLLYPIIGDEGKAQYAKTNTYPGMLRDVIVVLWLCTLPDSSELTAEMIHAGQFTPTRALSRPADAWEVALEWASANDMLELSGEPFGIAAQIFEAIVSNVSASEFHVATSGSAREAEPGKV